jgi:hypothetical protein
VSNHEPTQSWLSLLRAHGDTNLGQGIERLARLAAAAHREQTAQLATVPADASPRRPAQRSTASELER